MGEKKSKSGTAAKRSKSASKPKPGRRAAAKPPKARKASGRASAKSGAKTQNETTAAKKPASRSRKPGIAKTAETPREDAAILQAGPETGLGSSGLQAKGPPAGETNGIAPTAESAAATALSETEDGATGASQLGAARKLGDGTKSGTKDKARPGEATEPMVRPNTLVPTNAVHTTERRLKRRLHQSHTVMALIAATFLAILILGDQTEPPDMSALEQQIAAAGTQGITEPRIDASTPARFGPGVSGEAKTAARSPGPYPDLDGDELIEIERLLARLDLGPSRADGIVDQQTKMAIRLYQEIAGLPVDGRPSQALLADMREVIQIMSDGS